MSIRNQYAPMRINIAEIENEIIRTHRLTHSYIEGSNLINPKSATYLWLNKISFGELVLEIQEISKEISNGLRGIKKNERDHNLNIFDCLLKEIKMPKLVVPNSDSQLIKLLPVFIEHYALFQLNDRRVEWDFYDVFENHIGKDFLFAMESLANHGRNQNIRNTAITLISDPSLSVHLLA